MLDLIISKPIGGPVKHNVNWLEEIILEICN
jgi:hypothetical protein